MKKILLFLLLFSPLYVMAEERPVVIITANADGSHTLTFTFVEDSTATGTNKDEKTGTYRLTDKHYINGTGLMPKWVGNTYSSHITKVVFDKCFYKANVKSTSMWFYNLTNLEAIEGLGNLNTENVTDKSGMFEGCRSLTSLDLSKFNTDKVSGIEWMLYGCSSLIALNIGNNDFKKVTTYKYSGYAFNNVGTLNAPCKLIIGSSFDKSVLESLHNGNGTLCYYVWRKGYFTLDDSSTGIKGVVSEAVDDNAPTYNLAGQRVGKSYKGVVVVNGKKVLRK